MTPRQTLAILASASCLAGLCGCVGAAATQAPQDTTKFTVENTERFAALDPATEADVSCTGLQERTLGDGRMEIVANVRDLMAHPVSLQIQCMFLDEQGIPVGQAPWRVLAIAADSTEVVRFTAPDTAVRRYAIRARKAH